MQTSPHWRGAADRDAALQLFDAVAELFVDVEVPELRDLQAGHSYFLLDKRATSKQAAIEFLARRFAYEVYPLLLEYEAEGRYDPEKLATLLVKLGWQVPDRPTQAALALAVAAHFASGGQSPPASTAAP